MAWVREHSAQTRGHRHDPVEEITKGEGCEVVYLYTLDAAASEDRRDWQHHVQRNQNMQKWCLVIHSMKAVGPSFKDSVQWQDILAAISAASATRMLIAVYINKLGI